MAAVHFDAQLSPGPDISHGSPDLDIVDGDKVTNNLLELLEGLGLDFPITGKFSGEFFDSLLLCVVPPDFVYVFQLVLPGHNLDRIIR